MTEDDRRELIERSHQLNELTKHPGWEILQDYVLFSPGGSAFHQKKMILKGSSSWEEYQRDFNFVRGIHYVVEAPKRIEDAVRNSAPEEDE